MSARCWKGKQSNTLANHEYPTCKGIHAGRGGGAHPFLCFGLHQGHEQKRTRWGNKTPREGSKCASDPLLWPAPRAQATKHLAVKISSAEN
eukprot:scaffold167344_cov16-Tisochrysis_lutea.AAC.2